MSIIAQVAELEDWDYLTGSWGYQTGYWAWCDENFSRGSMFNTTPDASARGEKLFDATKTTACICARFGNSGWDMDSPPFFGFTKSRTFVLGVQTTETDGYIRLVKWNGSSYTTLATGSKPSATGCRFDIFVENYGVSAHVRVWLTYLNGSAPTMLWIDYTGDVASPGVTNLDGLWATTVNPNYLGIWYSAISEVIAADELTLRMRLRTISPSAAGDINTFDSGTYADVDERDVYGDSIQSGTAGQEFMCNTTGMPSGTFDVLSAKVTILAAKDAEGPTKMAIGIKSGGTISYGADQSLGDSLAPYSRAMVANPVTGLPFTAEEVEGLQIGCKSVA